MTNLIISIDSIASKYTFLHISSLTQFIQFIFIDFLIVALQNDPLAFSLTHDLDLILIDNQNEQATNDGANKSTKALKFTHKKLFVLPLHPPTS